MDKTPSIKCCRAAARESNRHDSLVHAAPPCRRAGLTSATLLLAALRAAADPPARPFDGAATRPTGRSRRPRRSRCPAAASASPAELEAFVDGFVGAEREAYDVAGLTVAVVKDGQVFFAKGYGWADVEQPGPGRRGQDAVPARFGLQALHLDGGHAARRAGQAGPRRRREHVPDAVQGSRHLPGARSRCGTRSPTRSGWRTAASAT